MQTCSEAHARVVKGIGFADKLKILAAKSLGFDRSDKELLVLMDSMKEGACISVLYSEPDAPVDPFRDDSVMHGITGREYLQFLGDNARQVFGEDFWVDQVLPRPTPLTTGGYNYNNGRRETRLRYPGVELLCLTDERYSNEAQRVHDLGGTNWEIIKPGVVSDGHASEKPLPRRLVDRQIINDGSLLDLFVKVADAYGEDFA